MKPRENLIHERFDVRRAPGYPCIDRRRTGHVSQEARPRFLPHRARINNIRSLREVRSTRLAARTVSRRQADSTVASTRRL